MFANACKLARCYTRPVVVSRRYFDGSVECGCGAFIVINEDGWILTAAHLLESSAAILRHAGEIGRYYTRVCDVQRDAGIDPGKKLEAIGKLKTNPRWITNNAFWWGEDGATLNEVRLLSEADLAVGRLDPFDPEAVTAYPILKYPSDLGIGTTLCKIGYPFQRIGADYNAAIGEFVLEPAVRSLACFPMEGIYTRTLPAGRSGDGRYEIKFLETSSPGLVGQSGGPIFDAHGIVWSVQSRTDCRPYEANATGRARRGAAGQGLVLTLGVGVHPELIVAFLSDNGVRYTLSAN